MVEIGLQQLCKISTLLTINIYYPAPERRIFFTLFLVFILQPSVIRFISCSLAVLIYESLCQMFIKGSPQW